MNLFELNRAWFAFAAENPDRVRPLHHAIVFFVLEQANASRWAGEFACDTVEACRLLGIAKKQTFLDGLKELMAFGVVREVRPARGRYADRLISLEDCPVFDGYRTEKRHGNTESCLLYTSPSPRD